MRRGDLDDAESPELALGHLPPSAFMRFSVMEIIEMSMRDRTADSARECTYVAIQVSYKA